MTGHLRLNLLTCDTFFHYLKWKHGVAGCYCNSISQHQCHINNTTSFNRFNCTFIKVEIRSNMSETPSCLPSTVPYIEVSPKTKQTNATYLHRVVADQNLYRDLRVDNEPFLSSSLSPPSNISPGDIWRSFYSPFSTPLPATAMPSHLQCYPTYEPHYEFYKLSNLYKYRWMVYRWIYTSICSQLWSLHKWNNSLNREFRWSEIFALRDFEAIELFQLVS